MDELMIRMKRLSSWIKEWLIDQIHKYLKWSDGWMDWCSNNQTTKLLNHFIN